MSTLETRRLVARLWNYCDVLRDDGVSTIDYVEQLTYLLFLKMAHERVSRRLSLDDSLADIAAFWQRLIDADGNALQVSYARTLRELGRQPDTTLGIIFRKAQNKIQDPAKLKKLIVDLIDKQQWSNRGVDVKGDAYEELLARSVEDVKSGAGQYFTPRAVIDVMVQCVRPGPDDTIVDPACGTGGFLLAAHDYIQQHHGEVLTREQRDRLGNGAIKGIELVDGPARLAAMNLLLHGIGKPNGRPLIEVRDALATPPDYHASVVLANPPFGKKSSITVLAEDGRAARDDISYSRRDFWVTTANKQLNFVQHIATLLGRDGRAAVVVPDNVLFEGGSGEIIRRHLLRQFDVHTLLRLPTGIFYAGGVKANVLFFDKKQPSNDGSPSTTRLWVYDFRTQEHFTLKQNPLRRHDLQDFLDCYLPGKSRDERVETDRFRSFSYGDLVVRDRASLDIALPSDDKDDGLLSPDIIAREIVEDLEAALSEFAAIAQALQAPNADEGHIQGADESPQAPGS